MPWPPRVSPPEVAVAVLFSLPLLLASWPVTGGGVVSPVITRRFPPWSPPTGPFTSRSKTESASLPESLLVSWWELPSVSLP